MLKGQHTGRILGPDGLHEKWRTPSSKLYLDFILGKQLEVIMTFNPEKQKVVLYSDIQTKEH